MTLIASQYIHNARNRLMGMAHYLETSGQKAQADEIQNIGAMLSSAMTLLKLENSDTPLSVQEVNLESFFSELQSQVTRQTPPNLKTHCESDFSQCVFPIWTFDEELIRMVLLDALMNAWQQAQTTVTLKALWQAGELIFTISDDGPGYPPAILENQGQRSTEPSTSKSGTAGTGNGLFLARQIAGKHQANGKAGRIELSNRSPESGAVFQLVLP